MISNSESRIERNDKIVYGTFFRVRNEGAGVRAVLNAVDKIVTENPWEKEKLIGWVAFEWSKTNRKNLDKLEGLYTNGELKIHNQDVKKTLEVIFLNK